MFNDAKKAFAADTATFRRAGTIKKNGATGALWALAEAPTNAERKMKQSRTVNSITIIQVVRVATQYAPAPLLPVGAPAPRAPPSRRNVAVLSHAEYVPTLIAAAALRVKAALSKAAW